MTSNGLETLNGKKYPVYTKYVTLEPKFWSVLLYDQPLSRYRTFYNSQLTTMLNGQKEQTKKWPMQKFKTLQLF